MEYEFSGKKSFTDYEGELMLNDYYIKTIDITNTSVLYVFEIPEPLFKVIELFINGKYSRLPFKEELKEFLRKYYAVTQNHKIHHILNRSKELRLLIEEDLGVELPIDIDLAEAPDITNEEINFKKDD
jgi:hypothetical protein